VDGDGNLYIADTGNHAIRKVTAEGTIHTIAGTGEAGFEGDGGFAAAARLHAPWGLALDGSGRLYVADSLNHRVRRLTPTTPPEPIELIEQAVVMNAATLAPGPVAPGGIVSIFAHFHRPGGQPRDKGAVRRRPGGAGGGGARTHRRTGAL
jgi:hypothetical protein